MTTDVAPKTAAHPRTRGLVAVFAVTQTIGYGVLFYTFSVLLTPMTASLSASRFEITIALTISVMAAAASAIPVGRWLDARGGRALMTTGSILGAAAVAAWSQVTALWQLYAVFAVIGLASAMSLYEAAFAVLIAVSAPERRATAMLAVTIVAGFASSIFFPLTGWLASTWNWRTALLVLAGLLALTAVPGHFLAVPAARPARQHATSVGDVRRALTDRGFWLLAASFVTHSAAVAAIGVLLVSYLAEAGHAATLAASLAGLLGILSVTGRLTTTALARRFGMPAVTAAIFAVQAAGLAMLPFFATSVAGAAACVVAFGLGFGVATIARPTILADRYGPARYATIAGTMALPMTIAKALAPLGAALLAADAFIWISAVVCLAAAGLLAVVGHRSGSHQ
ncbi:MFS transporter [Phytomonospora endophytica]|uniref:MFS family permease n=1 Tax=Phytomonospora endophytica TaxID=714109 RepID=A0A841FF36_9ACTN|nr:MFS transporter [Phytomonospora endophytica]MBB6033613.1 MFS family permease [Phytomonospora endophytica]